MFNQIQKKVSKYYDDDARYFLDRHDNKLYFIKSNHHNGELIVIVCDDSAKIWDEIAKLEEPEGAIVYAVEKAFLSFGGIKLGEDDELRKNRMLAAFALQAEEYAKKGYIVEKIENPHPRGYQFKDYYILKENLK